jgi:hypothetical protein
MRQLQSDTNREQIQRYIDAGGEGVDLSDKQQELLKRWRHADELVRQSFFGKFQLREDIAKNIMVTFEVSRDTAWRDITNAETVFSSSAPLNKKYFIQRRIEWISSIIAKLAGPVYDLENDTKMICEIEPENAAIAAKWEAILQKYVEAYPDFTPVRSPKNIIYNIQQNLFTTNITVEDAAKEADIIIQQIEDDATV